MANGDEAPRADSFCAHAITARPARRPRHRRRSALRRQRDGPRLLRRHAGHGRRPADRHAVRGGRRRRTRPAPTISRPCACWRRRSARTSSSPAASASARRRPASCAGSARRRAGWRASRTPTSSSTTCASRRRIWPARTARSCGRRRPAACCAPRPRSGSTSPAPSCRPGTARRSRQAFDSGERMYRSRDELARRRRLGRGAVPAAAAARPPGGRPDGVLEQRAGAACPSASCS